jgi:hypothetical protein
VVRSILPVHGDLRRHRGFLTAIVHDSGNRWWFFGPGPGQPGRIGIVMAWLIVLSPALLTLVGVVMVYNREVWYNAPSIRWAANPAPGVVVRMNPGYDLRNAA